MFLGVNNVPENDQNKYELGTPMKRPYFKIYPADFFAQSRQHPDDFGMALMRLLSAYWDARKLPIDDKTLARIAQLSAKKWAFYRSFFVDIFGANFDAHEQLNKDLAIYDLLADRNAKAAQNRWDKRDTDGNVIDLRGAKK